MARRRRPLSPDEQTDRSITRVGAITGRGQPNTAAVRSKRPRTLIRPGLPFYEGLVAPTGPALWLDTSDPERPLKLVLGDGSTYTIYTLGAPPGWSVSSFTAFAASGDSYALGLIDDADSAGLGVSWTQDSGYVGDPISIVFRAYDVSNTLLSSSTVGIGPAGAPPASAGLGPGAFRVEALIYTSQANAISNTLTKISDWYA